MSSNVDPTGKEASLPRPTYDAVTIHFVGEEEPFRIGPVRALEKSQFPETGEPALQVIEAPSAEIPLRDLGEAGQILNTRIEGIFEMDLILIRPEAVAFLVIEADGDRYEAGAADILGQASEDVG